MPKKIVLDKNEEVNLTIREDRTCDFCGEKNVGVFESEYSDDIDATGKVEMQICFDCIRQLSKLIPNE